MTTEEKAKRYDEAIEVARKIKNGEPINVPDGTFIPVAIFPELEDCQDEKTRKSLISYLHGLGEFEYPDKKTYSNWLAWLERQKTSEEALQYLKENHSPSEVSDFQTAMNIAVAKAYDKGVKDGLEKQSTPQDKGEISDGYHTFNELYYYRMLYNAAFFNMLPKEWVHKSKKHHDGEDCFGGGWFIVMANLPTGQVSNHYELKNWDLFQIPEKEVADKWDGHTPQEAADRLHKYLLEKQGDQTTAKKFSTSEVIDIVRQAVRGCESFSDIVAADKYAAEAIATVEDFFKKQSEQESAWSEEDEKIRKMLIKFFSNGAFYDSHTNGIPDKDIVAWLEKQGNNPYSGVSFEYNGNIWGMCARDGGVDILLNRELIQHVSIEKQDDENPNMAKSPQLGEQKPADKIEPKFKVGDWITNGATKPAQISSIEDDMYYTHNGTIGCDIESVDKDSHLWTIADAKAGDVLACESGGIEFIVILKDISKDGIINSYCRYNSSCGFGIDIPNVISISNNPHPATKEQRDTLFAAMKEAGYEWDAEKKELKKISQRMISAEAKEAMYGKPTTWSEEDENEVAILEAYIRSGEWSESHIDRALGIVDELVNKVKSLRPQKQWKPSETQVEALKEACDEHWEPDGLDPLYTLYQELKKLREE